MSKICKVKQYDKQWHIVIIPGIITIFVLLGNKASLFSSDVKPDFQSVTTMGNTFPQVEYVFPQFRVTLSF